MDKNTLIMRGVEAALDLAAMRAWSDLGLTEIAAQAGLTLSDFQGLADKDTLSAHVEGVLDRAMSEGSLKREDTARTRLFDVLMLRFDAMEARREGVLAYFAWRDGTGRGPAARIAGRLATARWALACAGLDAASIESVDAGLTRWPRPLLWAQLGLIIATAERAWRSETSSDLSRTMAALDADLLKLEARAGRFTNGSRRQASSEAEF